MARPARHRDRPRHRREITVTIGGLLHHDGRYRQVTTLTEHRAFPAWT